MIPNKLPTKARQMLQHYMGHQRPDSSTFTIPCGAWTVPALTQTNLDSMWMHTQDVEAKMPLGYPGNQLL